MYTFTGEIGKCINTRYDSICVIQICKIQGAMKAVLLYLTSIMCARSVTKTEIKWEIGKSG